MNSPDLVTPSPGRAINLTGPGTFPVGRSFEAPQVRQGRARDLALRLFYRRRLLSICLILGVLAGITAAVVSKPTYTADTGVIVLLGPEYAAAQDSLNLNNMQISIDGLKAVQSELQILQADDVIRSAIQEVGAAKLYPAVTRPRYLGMIADLNPMLRRWAGYFGFGQGGELASLDGWTGRLLPPPGENEQLGLAIEHFRGDLRVENPGSSNVIRVSFTHHDRDLAIGAVRGVMNAYLAKRRSIYANTITPALREEIQWYSTHLKLIDDEILAARKKYDVLDTAHDIILATNRLDGIIEKRDRMRERKVTVETEIVAVQANLKAQPASVPDYQETTNNTPNDEARNTLVRLMQDREHLVSRYNSNWPGLQELDQKIATVRAQIAASGQGIYSTARTIRNPAIDVLNNRLASLQIEDLALSRQFAKLDEESRVASQRIGSLREADETLHTLQLRRDVAEGIYRQLSLQQPEGIVNGETESGRNANVRTVQAPTAPFRGRSLSLTYIFGGAFLGLLLGLTAVVIATLLQQVYILPTDAERELGLPNLGDVDADRPRGDAFNTPRGYSVIAANVLSLSIDDRPLSMLQVVSLSESRSHEQLVRGLGVEFARTFAKRTLILDLTVPAPALSCSASKARRSAPARDSTKPATTSSDGLALADSIPIAATDEEGLWISVNARRALFGERGQMLSRAWQTIGSLRQRFEMVLVTAPSNLSEPLVHRLAGVVDANLLVLCAEQTRGAVAERFREMILEAGGNLAGFVFVGRRFYVPQWLYRRL
jgi:uncharacterized protein involved in exopolysaccharide biosynthesis